MTQAEVTETALESVREEYRQAWAHFRHVETERAQRLEYFLSITLAVVGFSVVFASTDVAAATRLLGLATVAHAYMWVAISLDLTVRRVGLVAGHYRGVVQVLRRWLFHRESDAIRAVVDRANALTNPIVRGPLRKWFGVQRNTEVLMAVFTTVGLVAQLGAFAGLIAADSVQAYQTVIVTTEVLVASVCWTIWARATRSITAVQRAAYQTLEREVGIADPGQT